MNLADLSIRRPIFMTCIIILSVVAGLFSMSRLGVDLFPNVTFPVVFVQVPYPGAGPAEVESLVSKPIEDELSTLAGIKRISSTNQEGLATVVAEFTLETDVKYAEQQIRDRVGATKARLPTDVKEPVIRRIDPADLPVVEFALDADLPEAELYDLANEKIKPRFEQVAQVGLVEIRGGRKREIQVQLDRQKLKAYEISASAVAGRLQAAGEDVPSGKKDQGDKETIFRTVGQFKSLDDIKGLIMNFFGNDIPVRLSDVGEVKDTLVDETSRAYINGKKALMIVAYRQSGANTIKVADALKARMDQINKDVAHLPGNPKITAIRDGSVWIRANVFDVQESIVIGIILSIVVVFFFLGNFRSTIITGLALPNSLIGAFILIAFAGFTINIMTLLALSLSVGLLIDDAIVVRENIFRHIEMGKKPIQAAIEGTGEVRLAVIAVTLTVIAVFGPLGFLSGVIGQFFKQFGLTVCFAMLISLFDALTIAPMLSAYFAGGHTKHDPNTLYGKTLGRMVHGFDKFQDRLSEKYGKMITWVAANPLKTLGITAVSFVLLVIPAAFVPGTFLPPQEAGEFVVAIDMPPGTSLDATDRAAKDIQGVLDKHKNVIELTQLTVGSSREGEPNKADIYVKLVPRDKRNGLTTIAFKDQLREELKPFAKMNPKVKDYDPIGGGQRPFTMNISGTDQKELERIALQVLAELRKEGSLTDVDVDFRPGKPEFQVVPDKSRALLLGTSTGMIGAELRAQIEGVVPAKFRQNGVEYDVRIRLKDEQRNLQAGFNQTFVPNLNNSLVRLSDVAQGIATDGPSKITRMNREKVISITADVNAKGKGMEGAMASVKKMLDKGGTLELPQGMSYYFIGQAENMVEMQESMAIAMMAGVIFIFLVLASLYESFVTPFTIMLAMPLAIGGSFVALFITGESLNLFSMIGFVMLMGVAVKNSILLVDYANQKKNEGLSRTEAIIEAGKTRLRPILMTTMALVAGAIPIAVGLNEASKQRTSMGVVIIGGLISSTLLTLVVVPATYAFVDRFREWSANVLADIFMSKEAREPIPVPVPPKSKSSGGGSGPDRFAPTLDDKGDR